jgi:hypothetical protein
MKFRHLRVWTAVFASWAVAFFEDCLQVPANRIGYPMLTAVPAPARISGNHRPDFPEPTHVRLWPR